MLNQLYVYININKKWEPCGVVTLSGINSQASGGLEVRD
jgi:hypothetical protein